MKMFYVITSLWTEKHLQGVRMEKVANLFPLKRGRESSGQVGVLEFREGIIRRGRTPAKGPV